MAKRNHAKAGSDASPQLSLDFRSPGVAAGRGEPKEELPPLEVSAPPKARRSRKKSRNAAEEMATKQREISISEFFAKNRHLLGFDNPRKALLTTVKEGVDNALDACEEAGILPDVVVEIHQTAEDRFRVVIQDNGPGIVKAQIPNIFGKLLYGSKFHRLKMSRGQQGIGISAAGMYGVLTTGRSIHITSRTEAGRPAHHYEIQIDTQRNRPDVINNQEAEFEPDHGTRVVIELVARYNKGRTSVDEYMEQTAIANPHASIRYRIPSGEWTEFPRASDELPPDTKEIKPHPHGIEMGLLMKMLKDSEHRWLSSFLQKEFCRVSSGVALDVISRAELSPKARPGKIGREQVETLYNAIQETRIKAPPTNCLAPMGTQQILAGLLKEIKADFYTAATRKPTVYRGNPFQIEVGLAYGGQLPNESSAKLIRYANRVPLLYQPSSCAIHKAVTDLSWRQYALTQPRGGMPEGPLVIVVHMASVWVPFTSESKEAIADYDEIRAEIRRALQECGRKLQSFIRRKQRSEREGQRRKIWERYIDELVQSLGKLTRVDRKKLRAELLAMTKEKTEQADEVLGEDGKPIDQSEEQDSQDLSNDPATVIVERQEEPVADESLFGKDGVPPRKRSRRNGKLQRAS